MNIVSCAHVFYATYKLTYHVDRYVMWWKGMRGKTRRTILYIGNLLSRDSSEYVIFSGYETYGCLKRCSNTLIHGNCMLGS
jgi:hypothetical protein